MLKKKSSRSDLQSLLDAKITKTLRGQFENDLADEEDIYEILASCTSSKEVDGELKAWLHIAYEDLYLGSVTEVANTLGVIADEIEPKIYFTKGARAVLLKELKSIVADYDLQGDEDDE